MLAARESRLACVVASFRIAELKAAEKHVEWINPHTTVSIAYSLMFKLKYSQLVVANGPTPRRQDIKGLVSFQSLTKALLAGTANANTEVRHCLQVPQFADASEDLGAVVPRLAQHDVVLVVGGPV